MKWRRVEPVQSVDALLINEADAPAHMAMKLASKPEAIRTLPVVLGEHWAAIFARPQPGESEGILPHLTGATALYRVAEGWWFPVGCALDVPEHAFAELLVCFAKERNFKPPVIIVPQFGPDDLARSADVYLVHRPTPLTRRQIA